MLKQTSAIWVTVLLVVLSLFPGVLRGQVNVSFDSNSISVLTWNGINFLGDAQAVMESVDFCSVPGDPQPGATTALTTVDPQNSMVTQQFGWGSVRTWYRASGDNLAISIQVTNSDSRPLCQLVYRPLHFTFPQPPPEFDTGNPPVVQNSGAPSVLQFSFGSGVMILANQDTIKPLIVGLPWIDPPLGYPLKINTGRNPMYPGSFPYIDRPIQPGATDQYDLSIRFGPPGTTKDTLATDLYRTFAAEHPPLVDWPDRRPFGDTFVASLAGRSPSNPRAYFGDPSLDVFSLQGLADFRQRFLDLADRIVSVMGAMNGQGVIAWDMEGYEFPQAAYVGDPMMLPSLAPEMDGVADEFFARLRGAGLKVGMTIRMQQAQFQPDGSLVQVQLPPDQSVGRLVSRIQYAQNRWGATIFYIDSNDYFDSDIFRQVATAAPGVLLIPEHSQLMHYAYGAPYIDARNADPCTPADVRKIYPAAFSVVNFVDLSTYYARYDKAKQCGETDLFRGSFSDGEVAR